MPRWQELLQAAVRARYRVPSRAAREDTPSIGRSAGGCLMRLVILVVFLFVALASGLFLFGRILL